MKPSRDITRLLDIMAALRTPVTGCPWDLEQDFKSIAPYTLEEAFEVIDAIERNDIDDLREELGDLLFAVTNIARHLKVEPEAALKLTNRKFRQRFGHIENRLQTRDQSFESTTLEELESLWQDAKTSKQPAEGRSTKTKAE